MVREIRVFAKIPSSIFQGEHGNYTVLMHFLLGAHMNPAVTLASAVVRRLAWIKVPVYCMAQFLGAFIASAIVYGIYYGRDMCMCMLCGLIF